jgi:hypothetical protein
MHILNNEYRYGKPEVSAFRKDALRIVINHNFI